MTDPEFVQWKQDVTNLFAESEQAMPDEAMLGHMFDDGYEPQDVLNNATTYGAARNTQRKSANRPQDVEVPSNWMGMS